MRFTRELKKKFHLKIENRSESTESTEPTELFNIKL